MTCVPTERFGMVTAAVPPLRVAGDPRGAPVTSLSCTVPVAEAGVTWAVKVTAWPAGDGFADDVRPTVEATRLTTCVTAPEVLGESPGSPG